MEDLYGIRVISIERIKAAAYNPLDDLQSGEPEYEKLRRSIEEFGYIDPIIWNERTGNMVGGHQRYKILVNELGRTEVEVSVVDLDKDTGEFVEPYTEQGGRPMGR
nr:ParB N-terminal domain-containing protein [Paenibacillus sp. E194]